MAIIMKRQLTDEEKDKVLQIHGRSCFATGHEIPTGESVHFDHVKAFDAGGASYLDNIAPMCEKHNLQKGRLPLEDFRVKLRLRDFFSHGDRLTLRDLLKYLKDKKDIDDFGEALSIRIDGNNVSIESAEKKIVCQLHECPITKSTYIYTPIDINWLDSDDDEDTSIGLQPRYLIFDKVFNLCRHFQQHPVLQPSVGRVVNNNRIRLFDGQHKVAALLWTGHRIFDCKIYMRHDIRLLNQTNIAAHDKFAQTRFFSSIMVLKLGSQFGNDFEKYKIHEDGEVKSEAGFMKFLDRESDQSLAQGELNKRFRSYLYNSVLEDENNKLSRFVSASNRSSADKPLTIDMLSKSLFSCFLYRHPVEDNMFTETYKRESEINNMVAFMNMLYDEALSNWDAKKAGQNDPTQRKLNRLFRSKSIMAWSEIVRDAVYGTLDLIDAEDREQPFYREFSQEQEKKIKSVISRLVNWQMWSSVKDSDIDRVLADKKSSVKQWFKDKGLTTGYLMGAPE